MSRKSKATVEDCPICKRPYAYLPGLRDSKCPDTCSPKCQRKYDQEWANFYGQGAEQSSDEKEVV